MRCRLPAVVLVCSMLAPAARAGDLATSVAREGQRLAAEANVSRPPLRRVELWSGIALIGGGLVTAFYGFGHPTGPVNADTVLLRPGAFPHDRGLGFVGVGLAAAGTVLAWDGFAHGLSVKAGAGDVRVERRFSF